MGNMGCEIWVEWGVRRMEQLERDRNVSEIGCDMCEKWGCGTCDILGATNRDKPESRGVLKRIGQYTEKMGCDIWGKWV
jgi:hypothetical protein